MFKPRVTTLVSLVSAASFVVSSWSCAEKGSERSQSTGRGSVGFTKPAGQNNSPAEGGTGSGTTGGGGGGLPAYLFSADAARGITPLVKPLERAEESGMPEQDARMGALTDLITEVLNGAMALDKHDPGRNFRVTVTNDDDANAMALNEIVVVNTGLLKVASALSIVMVLCHEVAHSTRNHSFVYEQKLQTHDSANAAQKSALDSALGELLTKSYNETTSKYTHKQADAAKIQAVWNAYWAALDIFNMTVESEADIVGGQICANIGYSEAQVVQGFTDLFTAFEALSGGSAAGLPDGVYDVTRDQLGEFLSTIFGRSTHPSDAERKAQVARVKALFVGATDDTLAKKWLAEYPAAAQPALGLNLLQDDYVPKMPGALPHPGPCRHDLDAQNRYVEGLLGRLE